MYYLQVPTSFCPGNIRRKKHLFHSYMKSISFVFLCFHFLARIVWLLWITFLSFIHIYKCIKYSFTHHLSAASLRNMILAASDRSKFTMIWGISNREFTMFCTSKNNIHWANIFSILLWVIFVDIRFIFMNVIQECMRTISTSREIDEINGHTNKICFICNKQINAKYSIFFYNSKCTLSRKLDMW